MSKLIFLVGMPGSGKTYWAEKISEATGIPWVDMDGVMEEGHQFSIADIFAARGEAGFRLIEQGLLKQIIAEAERPTVISCGGGTPCFYDNLALMKQEGIVIYLKAHIETLRKHLFREAASRPLLNHPDGLDCRLHRLIEERSQYYEQADYIFPIESVSIANFTETILTCISQP